MKTRIALITFALIATAATAHAQTGCVNSPECPTAVLATAGAAAFTLFRRLKR